VSDEASILDQTAVIRDRDGGRIKPGRYVWRGPHTDPVFDFRDCRDLVIEGVDVVVESPCSSVFWMRRTKTGPGVVPNTNHAFRDVRIFGNRKAWVGVHVGGLDENGEHMLFERVTVYGCSVTAFRLAGQQSKEHLLEHVRIESCDTGIEADSGFQWIGGTFAVGRVGVHLTRVGEPVKIQGVGFEACGRLLVTDGASTAAQPVSLDTVRFEADQLAGKDALGGVDEMIVHRNAGALTITNCRFGGGRQRIPRIALRGYGEQFVEFVGRSHFGSFGAYRVNPIVAQNEPEAIVTGKYTAARDEGDAQNTQRVDAFTVERIAA
jgi:hypothetical protein